MPSRRVLVAGGVVAALVLVGLVAGALAVTSFERPTVESTTFRWGDVTQSTTEIETLVVVNNPNPVGIPDVVSVAYTARLNDVRVATGRRTGIGFPPGNSTVVVNATMDNSAIVDWWVTHVNSGGQSTMSVNASVSGPFFHRQIPVEDRTIETDALSGMNGERDETVTVADRTVLRVVRARAEWGTANATVTPVETTMTVRNEVRRELVVRDVHYRVTLNDVVLANRTVPETYTVAPNARRELSLVMALDTQRMDEWWVTHVRNDERSRMNVTVRATVDSRFGSERVTLDSFGQNTTVETDIASG